MHVWLIQTGEPLPIDGENIRLFRTGMLAELLVSEGHSVVWWTSTFDHFSKKQRFQKDTVVDVKDRLRLKLLYGMPYRKNISLKRIANHIAIAKRFSKSAHVERKPDIILSSLPPILPCVRAVRYGKKSDVPVVLETRDLWPDLFLDLFPGWARWFFRIALLPVYSYTKKAYSGAYAVTGLTPSYVRWGVSRAGRAKTRLDRDFPLGYSGDRPPSDDIRSAYDFWRGFGIDRGEKKFIACFFGAMGRQFEIETPYSSYYVGMGRGSPSTKIWREYIRIYFFPAG